MVVTTAALLCLATNIYFEARGESLEGQFAVAEVTLNRVASTNYPDEICEVVWQPKQFSWTHDGKSDKPRDKTAWMVAMYVASTAINDWSAMEYSVVGYDVTHYHNNTVRPRWSRAMQPVATIGRHIFYRGKI